MNTKTLSVGDEVRVLFANKWWEGECVLVHNDESIVCFGGPEAPMYQPAKYFTAIEPRVSEEDRAVEEMEDVWRYSGSATITEVMRTLYRAGYRKQPPVDMDNPANWRAGDVVECVHAKTDRFEVGREYALGISRNSGNLIILDGSHPEFGVAVQYARSSFRFVRRP